MLFIKFLSFLILLSNTIAKPIVFLSQQNSQVIYALNEISSTNKVNLKQEIEWPHVKRVQSSYVLIKMKPDDLFYVQVTIRGQFGYGGIFKYIGKEGNEYKYQRTDGTAEDFLYVNYKLDILSTTQQYDENIIMKMLNFKTSFGLLMKF